MFVANKGATPLSALRPGTQVLFKWATWQKSKTLSTRTAIFRKGEMRLLVYQHGHVCGVVKKCDTAPRFRDFREWREPYATVRGKLLSRGWVLESDTGEVNHVH